jgi:hypothetical protein
MAVLDRGCGLFDPGVHSRACWARVTSRLDYSNLRTRYRLKFGFDMQRAPDYASMSVASNATAHAVCFGPSRA